MTTLGKTRPNLLLITTNDVGNVSIVFAFVSAPDSHEMEHRKLSQQKMCPQI